CEWRTRPLIGFPSHEDRSLFGILHPLAQGDDNYCQRFRMKYRFQRWHVSIPIALAVTMSLAIVWPYGRHGFLTRENIRKSEAFTTQAEYEQLFGSPAWNPNGRLELNAQATIVWWEDTVSENGVSYTRTLAVAFDTTGQKICSSESNGQ